MRMTHLIPPVLLATSVMFASVCRSATVDQTTGAAQSIYHTKTRWSIYSERREEKTGRKIANRIDRPEYLLQDQVVVDYVNRVARRLMASSGSERRVDVKVLMNPAFNAFTIPGGRIYLTVELLKKLDSEDELASVLGHEIGHVTARHWANHQSKRLLMRVGGNVVAAVVPGGAAANDIATPRMLNAFRREEEQEADSLGLVYDYRAGYDPSAFVSVLKKAKTIEESDPESSQKNIKDYPQTASRIARVEREITAFPDKRVQTAAAAKEFAAVQERLSAFELGPPTTLITFTKPRAIPPSFVNPTKITKFLQDETPPSLTWKDPSSADDDND